jgi:hypothetical protein
MTMAKLTKIKVPNSLYLPEMRRCLLSPQVWAQEAKDHYLLSKGMQMENDDENSILVLGQRKYKKTILFNPTSNVPIMYLAPLCICHYIQGSQGKLLLPRACPLSPRPLPAQ